MSLRHRHPVNVQHLDAASFGERLADRIAALIGSWPFLIGQGIFLVTWVTLNTIHGWKHWDEFPYILLNLFLSVQAAVAGPMILLAGNRQAQKDRLTLEHAATEADLADKQNQEILTRIDENTQLTRRVVEHLGAK